jgi:hypothetical protein
MKDLPNSFWAAVFIAIACCLAAFALVVHDKTDTTAVITMCASIITGAFGYIQGVKDGKNSVQVPLDGTNPPTNTTVTVNQPK